MSCNIVCRHGSDLAFLWLWHRLAAAAHVRPLACELPCAVGKALKKYNKNNKSVTFRMDRQWGPVLYSCKYVQSFAMTKDNMRKRVCIDVWLGHFAIQKKLTEQCKSTIIKIFKEFYENISKSKRCFVFFIYIPLCLQRYTKCLEIHTIKWPLFPLMWLKAQDQWGCLSYLE